MKTKTPTPEEKDAQIRAAGIVQSVIASGAPVETWHHRAAYGISLAAYFKGRLLRKKPQLPEIPKILRREQNG